MRYFISNVVPFNKMYNIINYHQLRKVTNLSTREILRSNGGKLSLITEEFLKESYLPINNDETDINLNVKLNKDLNLNKNKLYKSNLTYNEDLSPPFIDIKTFKNYLMVPTLGLRSIFSSGLIKINENKNILYKEYIPGSLAAHNYPLHILPREYSRRIDSDIFVKTFFEDERNYKFIGNRKIKLSLSPALKVYDSYPLLHKISGKLSLLFIFSGDLPNCQYNSVQRWLSHPNINLTYFDNNSNKDSSNNNTTSTNNKHLNVIVVLNSPANRLLGWAYNRYLETLARTIVEENIFMSITRKLNIDSTISLHQYRRQLPSILLLDPNGYIRWHAIGYPTLEAVTILNNSITKLKNEI